MNTNKKTDNNSSISGENYKIFQQKHSSKLLCTDKPLMLSGNLALILNSSDAAIVMQQVHFWLSKNCGKFIDGVHWIYNTYDQWIAQMPWISKWRIRQIFYYLRKLDLIRFAQHDARQYKRRGYYTINYEKLRAMEGSTCDPYTDRCVGFQHIEELNSHTSLQESSLQENITTENTHPPHPAAVKIEKEVEEEKSKQNLTMDDTPEKVLEEENQALVVEEPKTVEKPVKLTEDQSAARAEQNEKLELIDKAGIRLNVQLAALVRNFTLENVKNAITYYQETKTLKEAKNTTIKRPAGWLTDCLRNNWWQTKLVEPTKNESEFSDWYQKAIALGIVEDVPASWLAKDRNNQYLVRQAIPGPHGAPYTLTPWQELVSLTTKLDQGKEKTNNNDDFEESD